MINTDRHVSRGRWAISAMFFANGFVMGSWAPQIPLMLPRHQITESTLGVLILMFGLGAVAAMAFAGWLINRFGSRAVMRSFALLVSFGIAAIVLAPSLPFAIAAILFTGACGGSMDVAMNANAVEAERQYGKPIMSSLHGFWSLGGFIGGGLGSVLIGPLGPQGHALFASAVVLAIVLAAAPFLIADAAARDASAPKPAYAWPKAPLVYGLGLMALLCMIPEGAVLDWAALYLTQSFEAPVSVAGLGFAFYAGTMAIMRFAGDGVRARFGAVPTFRVSALVAAAGLLAAALAPSAPFALAAFAIAGFGIANTIPVIFSAAGNAPGLAPGAALSIVTLMGYSGILVAPAVIGFIAEAIGFRITFAALAIFLGLAGFAANLASSADAPSGQGAAS